MSARRRGVAVCAMERRVVACMSGRRSLRMQNVDLGGALGSRLRERIVSTLELLREKQNGAGPLSIATFRPGRRR